MCAPCSGCTGTRSCSSSGAGGRVWNRLAVFAKIIAHGAGAALGTSHTEYFPRGSGCPSTRTSRSTSIVVAQFAPGVQVSPHPTTFPSPKSVRPRTPGRS